MNAVSAMRAPLARRRRRSAQRGPRSLHRLVLAAAAVVMLTACAGPVTPRNTGVYLLIDTSGTYNNEVRKAEQIILFVLGKTQPGDSFAVARIDTASFTERNIIAKATFDDRPSTANQQKRCVARHVEATLA